jgi:hypothetical protein
MENVLKQVSDAVTDKPVTVTITVKPNGRLHKLLQKHRIAARERVFSVTQTRLGNLERISKLLVDMGGNLSEMASNPYDAISKFTPHLVGIVAIGLYNRKEEPPDSLYRFIEENVTPREMLGIVGVLLSQMNVTGFISTIILTRGLNVLEMSQQILGSSIAPGTQSAA